MFQFDLTITIPVVISLFGIGFTLWKTRRSHVDDRFKSGSDRMDRHEVRLTRIEQSLTTMPTRQDVHNLEIGMERMNGTMGRMEAVLEGNHQIMTRLENIVSRHEDHLLKGNS